MLTVLLDSGVGPKISRPLLTVYRKMRVAASVWNLDDPLPLGTSDAVLTVPKQMELVDARLESLARRPRIIVLADGPTPAETRRLFRNGADSVVDIAIVDPVVQALSTLAACAGGCESIPVQHGSALSKSLDEPPRDLTDDEERLLGLTATHSIEASGQLLGLSRRQTQRRFKRLCDDLGIESRLHAAVAAARWGIVDSNGRFDT